jgi:hypothetical protein
MISNFKSPGQVIGATDGTLIGNVGDRLKVDATGSITALPEAAGAAAVLKSAEITVATKVESDLSGVTYTVPTGKTFKLYTFNGSYDTAAPMFLRLKKQTGGAGAFVTLFRISLKQQGQDESNFEIALPDGLNVGVATDVFKVTYESALSKGTLWAGFTGMAF